MWIILLKKSSTLRGLLCIVWGDEGGTRYEVNQMRYCNKAHGFGVAECVQ